MTEKTQLTEQEVYSVLNFASALYGNNVFTPQLLNHIVTGKQIGRAHV